MGYQRDLDEIPDDELTKELLRREALRNVGLCTYCERKVTEPACRFPERHKARASCIHGKTACPMCHS